MSYGALPEKMIATRMGMGGQLMLVFLRMYCIRFGWIMTHWGDTSSRVRKLAETLCHVCAEKGIF